MVFFTKKQKAEYRKRQRRVKHAKKEDPSNKLESISEKEQEQENGVKEKELNEETKNKDENKSLVVDETIVMIPKDLSVHTAKKIRKDARREARKAGKDASRLQFVVEGTEPPAPIPEGASSSENNNTKNNTTNNNSNNKKKRKREFPCLNDLVKEQEEAQRNKEQEEARKQAEESLSQEYKSRYLALDCEMVGIGTDGKKSVLARVSLVDWDGEVVMDTFVQVPTRVTDFRTHVSGVTAKDIQAGAGGAMKESECREKVAKLLRGKVLVGHALKNDLHALLLTHPKADIRDTAKYRPFQRLGGSKWRPRKLRDLVKENLGMDIQQAGQSHDSTEDAKATMFLFRLAREAWEKELEEKSTKKKRKTPS